MSCIVDRWVEAASAAAVDIASQAFGWDATIRNGTGLPFRAPFGAYVPLSSSDSVVQLGIVAELSDCETMSRALLGMAPDEHFGTESDVADAIGEIANMLAGATKTRLSEIVHDIVLGLPLCVKGTIEAHAVEQVSTEVCFGPVRANLMLLRNPSAGPRSRPRAT